MQIKKPIKSPVGSKSKLAQMPKFTPDTPGAKKPVIEFMTKKPVANKPYMPKLTNAQPGAKKPTISKGGIGNKEVNKIYRNQGIF